MKDRIKELVRLAAGSLKPFPKNPSVHTDEQTAAVKSLLDRFGFVDALKGFRATKADAKKLNEAAGEVGSKIEYSAGDVVVFDGHLRRDIAGKRKVQVLILNINYAEAAELIASFDFAGSLKEYNRDLVADLFAGINVDALGEGGFGETIRLQAESLKLFKDYELPNLYDADDRDLGDPDEIPEPPAEPITQRGDIWRLGDHRLMCGDATNEAEVDRLMNGITADICFTSPPYGLGEAASIRSANKDRDSVYDQHDDAGSEDWLHLMNGFLQASIEVEACRAWVVNVQMLAGNKRELIEWLHEHRERLVDVAIWNKKVAPPTILCQGVLNSTFEYLVILAGEGAKRTIPSSTWRANVAGVYDGAANIGNAYSEVHGAVMPVHLAEWVLTTLCDSAASVYDPFAGVGTTIVAAEQAKRSSFGMEISPAYVDTAVKRWEEFTGKEGERIPQA